MKKRSIFLSVTSILLALLLSSCSVTPNIRSTELSLGFSRSSNVGASRGDCTAHARGELTDVSLALFRESVRDNEGQNNVISPLSAVLCLALMANGSSGATRAQIETALGMSVDELNGCLRGYTDSLDTTNVTLALANSIWIADGIAESIRSDFLQVNADYYAAQVYKAPMDSSTVDDINKWVKHNTDGLIDKIIEDADIDTVMILINTLLFDAKWADPYEKNDISDGKFHNYDGTSSNVNMLYSEETYIGCDGADGFVRRYEGGNYAFVGLLPSEETDIYDYIATLDGDTWRTLWESRGGTASVKMPEFKISSDTDLEALMRQLGVVDMFESTADFSGMSDALELYCDSFRQKAVIEVDRNGTKAAAVSWGAMDEAAVIFTKSIILDRPFVYAVVDCGTGLPLFIGAVATLS